MYDIFFVEKLLNPVSQLNPSLNQNSDMFINQNKFIKIEPSMNDTGMIVKLNNVLKYQN